MNKVCKTICKSLIAITMILGVCVGSIQQILALNWGPAFYYPENDSSQDLVYLETIEDAWEFAKSSRTSKGENIVVYLNSNRMIYRPFYLGENESATIDMNGHYIKFRDSYGGYFGIENGEIFNLGKNSTLILKGSNPRTFGYEGWCYTDESTGELSISYDTKYMEVTAGGLLYNSTCYNTAGVIYMSEGAHAYLYNIAICGNEAMDRSGIADTRGMIRLAGDNAYLYLENSEISHNWGTVAGGIGVDGGTENCEIVMVNSKVEYNLERTPNPKYAFGGAGLLISSYAKLTMDNSSISHNVSVNKVGGGIKASDGMEIVLNNNSHIDYNETRKSNDGGGIYADGVLKITGDGTGTISYNSSSNDGGGILINNDDCYISNVTINGNTAKTGAGIYIDKEDTTIENCVITNNIASGNGGGIYDDNDGNVIKNCTITGNKTTSGKGGGVYVYGTVDVELRGKNIITGNKKGDSDNNLYLDNWGLSKAYIKGSVDAGSLVGISSSSDSTRQVGDELYNYIDGTFLLDSNRDKYHLEYVSSDHELFIREGESAKYTVYVNGQELGKYHYGDKVVVSDNNFNPEKVFVEWDTVNSTGYTIPKERKSKPTFTIDSMPLNDVHIEAYYAKKMTGLTLKIDKPVAGSNLPNSLLSMTNTTNESVYKTDKYEWLEVNGEDYTPTSGTAKYNTSYAIKLQMQQDVPSYLVFSESLKPYNVIIQYGDVTVQAKEVSVDSDGTLTVISRPIKTDLATITSFNTDSIMVHKGISKEELIAELPTSATGNSNEVVSYDSDNNPIYKKQIYTVNKEGITTELDCLLDENGKVVRPETGTVQVTLPVTAQEDLKIGENVTYQVKVTVFNDDDENITSIKDASINVPVGVTVDEFKNYLPSTTTVETSSGYTKEINVNKDSLGDQLNRHLDDDGKLVKVNTGEYYFEINLDVVTDENLKNTDHKQMKVTVNVTDSESEVTTKDITPDTPDTPEDKKTGITVSDVKNYVYNAEEHKETITIKDTKADKVLVEGIDYDVTYSRNKEATEDFTNVGTITITVTGKGNYSGSFEKTYNITPAPATVIVKAEDTGKVYGTIDPELTATVTGLNEDDTVEYSVTRTEGEDVGSYEIKATGEETQGNYTVVYESGTFTITAQTINPGTDPENPDSAYNGVQIGTLDDVVYNGTSQQQKPTVTDKEGTALIEGTDYEVSFSDDTTNVGEVTVTVTGIGNYTGEVTRTYNITPATVTVTVKAEDSGKVYGTTDPELTATVTGLNEDDTVEYSVTRTEGEDVGSYEIKATGEETQGNYTVVYESGTFTITAQTINPGTDPENPDSAYNGVQIGTLDDVVYNGTSQQQKPTVTDKEGTALIEGTDYEVSFSDDTTNVGEVTVTVTGIGNYTGEVTRTYNITKRDVILTASSAEKVYDGTPLTATEVTVEGDGFVEGEVSNLTATGTITNVGSVTNGISYTYGDNYKTGNYNLTKINGTLTVTSKSITPDTPETSEGDKTGITVTDLEDVTYNGESQQQKPEIKDETTGKTLVEGEDYDITYPEDTTNAGQVTVTITGKGNYTGSYTVTYNINKRNVTFTSPSATPDSSVVSSGSNDSTNNGSGSGNTVARAATNTTVDNTTTASTPEATATPASTPKATSTPTVIGDDGTPEVVSKGHWAIANLVLGLLSVLIAVMMLAMKSDENDKTALVCKVVAGVSALASVVTFVLTQQIGQSMVFADAWTILMAIYGICSIATICIKKFYLEDSDTSEEE